MKSPSHWRSDDLGNLVNFKTGKLNSNAATVDGQYPFFTCSQETLRTNTFSFDTECVLLAGNNANGIYPLKYFRGLFDAYQRTYVITPKDCRTLNTRFLYYALRLQMDHLKSISTGAATKFLTLTLLNGLRVTFPNEEEHRKIVSLLSIYDDLIANNTRRIVVLDEMVQSLYREWFVRFRFPGHEQTRFVDMETGRVPEGWLKRLSEVAKINPESIKKGSEPDSIHYVDIASVSTGKIDEVTEMPFSKAPGRARRIVKNGDIIWSTVRPNRKSYALILKPPANMVVSTGFAVIRGSIAPFSYLYSALTTETFVTYLVNHAKGSAYPAVNSDDFENAIILVPSPPLLAKFNEQTQASYLLKHNLETKNQNLRRSRDMLLPKLISGELDVKRLGIDTGEPEAANASVVRVET